jgi:DNA-binding transcriptional ArsR family regulator
MALKVARPLKANISDMEEKAGEAAELLAAMASPVRLLLLCAMVDGEKSVSELVARTQVTQSAVSQHLGKMRLQGLVAARRDGQVVYYKLANKDVIAILGTLYNVFCRA